jgi:bacillithiol biosynthesis deacetylase BshB1
MLSSGVDILAFGAHPDDVELGCGGTIAQQVAQGKTVAICDLTAGEMGSRGTAEGRRAESLEAAKILGVRYRIQLQFSDGNLSLREDYESTLVSIIRFFRPKVILCNAPYDRHPDHGVAAQLVENASFKSGLIRYSNLIINQPVWIYSADGTKASILNDSPAFRALAVYHYIQALSLEPSFVVDISSSFEIKMKSILAHRSQFYDETSLEPATMISSPEFLDLVKARCLQPTKGLRHWAGKWAMVEAVACCPGLETIV